MAVRAPAAPPPPPGAAAPPASGPPPRRSAAPPASGPPPRRSAAPPASATAPAADPYAAARAQLRAQIAVLERRLADAAVTAFADRAPETAAPFRWPPPAAVAAGPRLLDLGALEAVRDDLAARLSAARTSRHDRAERREAARVRLERMLLDPRRHRFERVAQAELGEGGCGVWQVRPRLGLVGMLVGWWQVKLSSGCPLPGAPRIPASLVERKQEGRR
jgi:hypothetical protein